MAGFAELAAPGSDDDGQQATYPGSKKLRRAVAAPEDPWKDVKHVELTLRGVPVRFYTVGTLAMMLERKPPAIRKWERLGYIPESPYRSPARTKNGQRRLYTREQIEGLVVIAREEGLTGDQNRNVSATSFPARAQKLFEELKQS